MELYIAICCDHHIDEDVKVFALPEDAIKYAKDFVPERYDLEENELTDEMKHDGWIYWATYGVEGDNVRVEKGQLN